MLEERRSGGLVDSKTEEGEQEQMLKQGGMEMMEDRSGKRFRGNGEIESIMHQKVHGKDEGMITQQTQNVLLILAESYI